MKKILTKPHIFFFGLALFFIVIIFINGKSTINISYLYYDIEVKTFCLFSSLFFGLIGFNYFSIILANKQPKKWLTITHIVLQTIALVPFIYLLITAKNSSEPNLNQDLEFIIALNFIGFILFLLASFIHLINFFVSLFLKRE